MRRCHIAAELSLCHLVAASFKLYIDPMKRFLPPFKKHPTVSVLRLQGTIAASSRRGMLNDAALGGMIERAFRKGKPRAVALILNSPGGSPAQSSLIASRIRRLAEEKDIPVYAFVEDVAASGGYWLATAADEIYVDATSIVGSIGVISAGFGFQDLIARHGIERRVHTSGTSKSKLDPFQPEKPEDLASLAKWQDQLHQTFIEQVKSRRGDKLSDDPDLFTGEIWIGANAVEQGLVDGIAHLEPKMKELFGDDVRLRRYGVQRSLFQRLSGSMFGAMMHEVEERAQWARYGL